MLTLENGDQVAWDGSYYDFRDSAGVKMIKMWIPPGIHPVRGVFISGHGGGGGDSRNFARDENVRALAMRLGFAVAGLHNFPGRRVYEEGAAVFFEALDHFARMGHHPELAYLPFACMAVPTGGQQLMVLSIMHQRGPSALWPMYRPAEIQRCLWMRPSMCRAFLSWGNLMR